MLPIARCAFAISTAKLCFLAARCLGVWIGWGLVLQITSKGEAELKKAWPVYRDLIVNLFGRHFSEDELDFLAQRFAKVADELDNPFV
jgi:hypothetical protein